MKQGLATICKLYAILMQPFPSLYTDWKDFFKKKLTASATFHLSSYSKIGKTDIEIYASSIPDFKTTIEVGYESPLCLSFLHILNPFTPGMNKQQKEQSSWY